MKETIEILIEANSAGMQTQLKQAGNTIQSFVNKMNEGSINWQKILTEGISDAVLVGIAGTFAEALASSIDFNNALVTSSNNSSQAFTSNLQNASNAAINTSNATGQSASDVVSAYAYATTALNDYASGHSLVDEASKIATATGMNLIDVVKAFIPVAQEWQIPASGMASALRNLYGESLNGEVGLSQLLSVMGNTGGVLHLSTNITDAGAALEAFSKQAGMTPDSAAAVYEKISNNLLNTATSAQNSAIGMGSYNHQLSVLKSAGMGGLLADMEKHLKDMGDDTAKILLSNAGFSTTDVANLVSADKSYASIAQETKDIAANAPKLAANAEANLSVTTQLGQAWNRIKNDIMEIFGPTALTTLKGFASILDGISKTIEGAANIFSSIKPDNLLKSLGTAFAPTSALAGLGIQNVLSTPSSSVKNALNKASNPSGNTINNINSNNTSTTNNTKGSAGSPDNNHGILNISLDLKKFNYNAIFQ